MLRSSVAMDLIPALRILFWLLSGWGCQGQHLSRGQGRLRTHSSPWRYPLATRMPCPVASVPVPRWARSTRSHDARGFFETRRLLGSPDAAKGKPLLGHRSDTKQDTKQGNHPWTPIHRERPLEEGRWPLRDYGVRLPFVPGESVGS